jgi:hypothetical protein
MIADQNVFTFIASLKFECGAKVLLVGCGVAEKGVVLPSGDHFCVFEGRPHGSIPCRAPKRRDPCYNGTYSSTSPFKRISL